MIISDWWRFSFFSPFSQDRMLQAIFVCGFSCALSLSTQSCIKRLLVVLVSSFGSQGRMKFGLFILLSKVFVLWFYRWKYIILDFIYVHCSICVKKFFNIYQNDKSINWCINVYFFGVNNKLGYHFFLKQDPQISPSGQIYFARFAAMRYHYQIFIS